MERELSDSDDEKSACSDNGGIEEGIPMNVNNLASIFNALCKVKFKKRHAS